MTEVLVDLRRPNADGDLVEVQGTVQWRPTRRRDDGSVVVLPQGFERSARTPVTVTVAATGPDWCWEVTERTTRGITRYVAVPASDAVIPYTALVDVDPATLEPSAEPEAAWWAALVDYSDAATAARDDAVAAAAGSAGSAAAAGLSASAAAVSEGLAEGHASVASGSAGSAASSASAASGSAVAAAGSEGAAAGHATDAQSALGLTVAARDLTLGYRDTASTAATTATTQAGLATTARTGAEAALAATLAASTIVGVGRPDIPATLTTPGTAALVAAATSGAVFRSLDGPQGAWEWRKRGTTWMCEVVDIHRDYGLAEIQAVLSGVTRSRLSRAGGLVALSLLGSAAVSGDLVLTGFLPAGFRPATTYLSATSYAAGTGVQRLSVTAYANGRLDLRGLSAGGFGLEVSWRTSDAVPTALPGTAA